MADYIEEIHTVGISGYVRGTIDVKVYFDPITKERCDFNTIGEINIIRDDTEIDTYDLPNKAKDNE